MSVFYQNFWEYLNKSLHPSLPNLCKNEFPKPENISLFHSRYLSPKFIIDIFMLLNVDNFSVCWHVIEFNPNICHHFTGSY